MKVKGGRSTETNVDEEENLKNTEGWSKRWGWKHTCTASKSTQKAESDEAGIRLYWWRESMYRVVSMAKQHTEEQSVHFANSLKQNASASIFRWT